MMMAFSGVFDAVPQIAAFIVLVIAVIAVTLLAAVLFLTCIGYSVQLKQTQAALEEVRDALEEAVNSDEKHHLCAACSSPINDAKEADEHVN
jgi:hypothetical protein